MGAGAGKNPAVGMPISPMVELAEKQSKKTGQELVIDAPALVDLNHGTVRYRKPEDDQNHYITNKEGHKSGTLKTGYFYHSRLDDYSEAAIVGPDERYKLNYVYKSSARSKGKQLHYCYGIGFGAKDERFRVSKTYKPKGRGYVWPSSYRNPNHLYYDLTFKAQDADLSDDEDEDVENDVNSKLMSFKLTDTDTVDMLKKRAAVRLLMPSSNIHISHNEVELSNEDTIGNLRTAEEGEFQRFTVEIEAV
ncbi:uncharacterized protein [Amphiura filiformis]|uniref:uncharacterized protein n=1 Tax=Amphiura filiformis TaxID=82378 RepID=UPI003B222441